MTLLRKSLLTGAITIAAMIIGFIFLLKGCLAKYDERFIKTPALIFEKNGKTVIFSIVEFQKTTSYSQKGNSVRKSVYTRYYVQSNDGETAGLIASKKIKSHGQVKNFPIEMLGPSGNTAWLFMGEPMAFDAFSLEKTADIEILEQKNPSLKGKFPKERQFYEYNRNDSNIYFTATDGTKWQLNTKNLAATRSDYKKNESPLEHKLALLEKELKKNKEEMDTLYQQNYRASTDYSAGKITPAVFRQISTRYYAERDRLDDKGDSLKEIKRQWEKSKDETENIERAIKNLQRSGLSFSGSKINQDTTASVWFGLYSDEELEKLNDWVRLQNENDETVRRKLFTGSYSYPRYGNAVINKPAVKNIPGNDFLAGGFLLNKETARPIHLPGNQAYLIIHKDQVGNEGKILVSNVSMDGKTAWTFNTNLTQWSDWVYAGSRLYIFGVDNKNLSGNESNVLLSINLATGTATKFDYFKNKKRE